VVRPEAHAPKGREKAFADPLQAITLLDRRAYDYYLFCVKEGKIMNMKKAVVNAFLVLGLAVVILGCAAANRETLGSGSHTGKPPVITNYFAPVQGMYGDALKIYLAAEDPDADMLRIAVQVIQTGYGVYPTSWIFLEPENTGRFVGYLQWNTFSSHTQWMPEWTQLTIKVSVFDKAGNESNEVVLPYEFATGRFAPPDLPAPFNQAAVPKLGYINVNLYDPSRMGDGRIFER
jgi:hypothetical protein